LLLFLTPLISKSTKRSAAQFVLEYGEQDKAFFEEILRKNILTFEYDEKTVKPEIEYQLRKTKDDREKGLKNRGGKDDNE
jgi:hypothetical protein